MNRIAGKDMIGCEKAAVMPRLLEETGAMSGIKEDVIRLIEALPEDVTADDVLAEIHFKMQVDAGLKELNEGHAIAHEVVEERMSKWLSR